MTELQHLEERVNRIRDLRDILYTQKGCACGGPLHIMLDDSNLRDSDIVFCYQVLHEDRWQHVRALGLAILHELMFLSPAQRYLWWDYSPLEVILGAAGKDVELLPDGYQVRG